MPKAPARFGRFVPPDEALLAKRPPEPVLDPDLPIIVTGIELFGAERCNYVTLDGGISECMRG